MTNVRFFETREEAKKFEKEMKKKGRKNMLVQKEKVPFELEEGKKLYYSASWKF